MTFGNRLRVARKAKQLTQKELAARINAAHNSISNWENDQNLPDHDTILRLCRELDVQPNYFFSIDSLSETTDYCTEQEIEAWFKESGADIHSPIVQRLIKSLAKLPEEGWEKVLEYMEFLAEKHKKETTDQQ